MELLTFVNRRFNISREIEDGYIVDCPACKKQASLLVRTTMGYLAFACSNTGCSQDITAALGVTMDELDEELASNVGEINWSNPEPKPINNTESARLVLKYLHQTGRDVSFTHEAGWFLYDGAWRARSETTITSVLNEVMDKLYEASHNTQGAKSKELAKFALFFGHVPTQKNTLEALKGLEGVERKITDFDADDDALATPNGIVDLRTGVLRDYTPADLVTLSTKASYNPEAEAPRFEQFIREMFVKDDGTPDEDLIETIHTMLGAAITGHNVDQILPVLYNYAGSNGKSVLMYVLREILGNYCHTVKFSTFEENKFGGNENKYTLAELRTARLVVASEGGQGKPMDDAVIKAITGGDAIRVRQMYKTEFSYLPKFMVILSTNHKPEFTGQDGGLWRRVKLVALKAEFKEGDPRRDPKLRYLMVEQESEGILAWLVRGAMKWYSKGSIKFPKSVTDDTEAYRKELDPLTEFENRTLTTAGPKEYVRLKDAWLDFVEWHESLMIKPRMTPRSFSKAMSLRYERRMRDGYVVFLGVRRLNDQERNAKEAAAESELVGMTIEVPAEESPL